MNIENNTRKVRIIDKEGMAIKELLKDSKK